MLESEFKNLSKAKGMKVLLEMIGIDRRIHGDKLLLEPHAHIEYVSVWQSSSRYVSFKADYLSNKIALFESAQNYFFFRINQ